MTRTDEHDPLSPLCRPTVDRLNHVLDGDLPATALDADPHSEVCAACRARIAAARLLLSPLPSAEPLAAPAGLTDRIVNAVRADRRARNRQRVFALVGGLAVAAGVVVAVWLNWPANAPAPGNAPKPPDTANVEPGPEVGPAPREVTEPRPIRIGDEFSKMGQALRGTPKPITDPVSAAPAVVVKISDVLTQPGIADAAAFEPARAALAELPDAARTTLAPVTGTAQKAFARLMRDVSSVSTKPKT